MKHLEGHVTCAVSFRETGTMAGILDKGIGYPGDKRLKKMEMLI